MPIAKKHLKDLLEAGNINLEENFVIYKILISEIVPVQKKSCKWKEKRKSVFRIHEEFL